MTQKTKLKISATKTGSHHSEETKRKISISMLVYRQSKRRQG